MKLIIRNEDDAWAALERATRGEGFPDDVELTFDGWPIFHINLQGKDWNSSVPTRVMQPLLEVQKDINRAYANIRYGEFNLRKLKDEERDELEVVVKVAPGSSDFQAELAKQLTQLGMAAVGRMSGTEIVIAVVGVALTFAAHMMFRSWLAARQKEKETEAQIQLSQEETERLRVFAEAVAVRPDLQEIREDVQATNNRILKAVKPGDSVSFKGVNLRSDEVEVLVQPERERAEDLYLEGVFRVLGNRTDKSDGFRITVERLADKVRLNADVPLELPDGQQKLIQEAEWTKKPVRLSITASMLRESISQAVVTSAQEHADTEPPTS